MIEDERNGEVVVALLVRIVENCRGRMGCRTLIVDLGITIIRLRSSVREHSVVAMLVIEWWCFYKWIMMLRTAEMKLFPAGEVM